MTNFIQTTNGRFFYDNMGDYPYTPEEVFTTLSRINRFNAHGRFPFTVAHHILHILMMAGKTDNAIHLLLHDASEAYLTDVPSPLKALLPQYKIMEANCMYAIYTCFNINYPTEEQECNIKFWDSKALLDEGATMFGLNSYFAEQGGQNSIIVETLACMSESVVSQTLIKEYYKLKDSMSNITGLTKDISGIYYQKPDGYSCNICGSIVIRNHIFDDIYANQCSNCGHTHELTYW